MKHISVILICTMVLSYTLSTAQHGGLDVSFDNDGITHFDLGGAVRGKSVAILPDGKILTAGTHGGAATQDFLIDKFNNKRTINIKKIVL